MQSIVDALADTLLLPSFLPGMLAAFSRILSGDFKRGSSVFEAAVDLLAFVVVTALGDSRNPVATNMNVPNDSIRSEDIASLLRRLGKNHSADTAVDPSEGLFPSRAWFSKAVASVVPLLSGLFRIANRGSSLDEFDSAPISAASIAFESARVRIAVCRAARLICLRCSITLRDLVPLLLDVLVTMRHDPFPEVAAASETAIQDLGPFLSRGFAFQELLHQNLERLLASLPRVIRLSDDTAKLMRLRALFGYLLLLRNSLSFTLPGLLPRLSDALVDCLEINLYDPWLSRTKSSPSVEGPAAFETAAARPIGDGVSFSSLHLRRHFLHFQDPNILSSILQILHLLGAYGDRMQLTDHFLSVFRGDAATFEDTSRRCPPQAILIVNEIIVGATSRADSQHSPNSDLTEVVDYLLVHYLSNELWSDEPMLDKYSVVSHQSSTHRAVVSSLLVEGIGVLILAVGPSIKFRLMDILYPLLEKLGDDTEMVSSAAWSSLLRVAFTAGYGSVLELVQDNSDYIVDSIVQNLRYLKKYGPSIRVLQGILRHSGELIVPILGDIVDEIFRCLDQGEKQFYGGFLRIMAAATELVKSKVLRATKLGSSSGPSDDRVASSLSADIETNSLIIDDETLSLNAFLAAKLRDRHEHLDRIRAFRNQDSPTTAEDFFKKYHEEKEHNRAMDMHPTDDEPAESPTDDDPSARRPGESASNFSVRVSLAKELKVIERMLDKCQHFTAVSGVENRIAVLEMISSAIISLDCDQNTLLPLVHQIWEPLSYRFTDEDQRVAHSALKVMQVLAEHCGEFVSKRFAEELWPHLKLKLETFNPFLRSKQASSSACDEASQYSSMYRRSPDLFKFSPAYKRQRACLDCLLSACQHASLPRLVALDIVSTIWFYFDPVDQPQEFVSVTANIVNEIKQKHGDMVWRMSADLARVVAVAPAASLNHFGGNRRKLRIQHDDISFNGRNGKNDPITSAAGVEARIGPICRSFLGTADGLVMGSC
eukprot:TRINITY_DN2357_c0_g1_i1.p1 TRINITY_DN2357_c0_g1~~TRINITY_DN2357_c0_g1_i1.p1  ORF type:complete len:996 (+),score=121.68 TRINITY_DN2357_c0_g1_i1:778-3765(+)